LAVESPGGTISGSDELYHAVEKFKKETGRPIVVSMQGLATSGAYYISMPANKIFADRSCVTGSIGVIAQMFVVEDLMQKVGVVSQVVKSGKMKDSGSPFRKMSDEERAEWEKLILGMQEQFLGVILKHRNEQIGGDKKLREIADGRVYIAGEAKELGLVDELGFEEDAIAAAKELAGLTGDVRVVEYTRPLGGLLEILGVQSTGVEPGAARLAELSRWMESQGPRGWLLPAGSLPTGPLLPALLQAQALQSATGG
ncbi:MAG: signal peptide peptidase SppA, partial [Planctomycetia bacterium]